MEKSSAARALPVVKAVYSFLRDEVSASFHFPGWNKGRIVCHRPQLKRLLSSAPDLSDDDSLKEFVSVTNLSFPLPGTLIHTANVDADEPTVTDKQSDSESEAELMAAAVQC